VSSRINLELRPSFCAGFQAGLPWLVLTVFIVIAAADGIPELLLLAPAVAVAGWQQYSRAAHLRRPDSVTRLRLDENGLHCCLASGDWLPVRVCDSTRLSARTVILRLRHDNAGFGQIITVLSTGIGPLPGNVPAQEFRRLRAWLRVGRGKKTNRLQST